jgi:hypothetical protein
VEARLALASAAAAARRSVMSRRWAVKSVRPPAEVGAMASSAGKRAPSARSASTSTRRPSTGPFAGGQVAREPAPVRSAQLGRDDQLRHVGPERRRARVAEGALGGRVPLHDAAVLVDGDDAVERRLQDGGLQRLAVAQRRLHLQPADGRAEQAGEGQQEVLVLPAEAARRSGVRLQHAPGRPAGQPHRHVQQRDDAVPAQQAGPLEAFRRADVLERDGPAGPERAARRRSHAGGERGAADHAGLPADAGADQQVAGLGAVLQDLGPFDAEAAAAWAAASASSASRSKPSVSARAPKDVTRPAAGRRRTPPPVRCHGAPWVPPCRKDPSSIARPHFPPRISFVRCGRAGSGFRWSRATGASPATRHDGRDGPAGAHATSRAEPPQETSRRDP